MDVQIQRPTEALDHQHGAAATLLDAVTTRAAPEEPEHRADGHAEAHVQEKGRVREDPAMVQGDSA